MQKGKIKVLMCCSDLSVKGGMVSVLKNYLAYENWEEFEINYIPTHIEKNKARLLLFFLKAYFKILFQALRKNIDIAYLHVAERGSVYRKALILHTLKKFNIKVVLHHHGAEFESFYAGLPDRKKQYVNKTLALADLNIVLSQRLVPMIASKSPAAKIIVLYNSVKIYENNPYNPHGKNILFLGRLEKRKGIYDFLEAIKILNDRIDPDIRFLLCGDGDLAAVKNQITALEIEKRISYIGWAGQIQKENFFSTVLVHVLPSYNEGLPMSILETMAYGIPNISTSIASIPEVIANEHNGYLINPGDVNALVKAIETILNCEALRKEFSHASWTLIQNRFSFDRNMDYLKRQLRRL